MVAATPVIPDLDIWLKAFSRHTIEPLVVHEFARHLEDRRIFLLGWVRQGLLSRVADHRQFTRLGTCLQAFPDLPVLALDHHHAARRSRELREQGVRTSVWQALLWSVAVRIGGEIWSGDRRWRILQGLGCPVR